MREETEISGTERRGSDILGGRTKEHFHHGHPVSEYDELESVDLIKMKNCSRVVDPIFKL